MKGYIEERPEAIAAIKKAIDEKWNPICMGCVNSEPECELCLEFRGIKTNCLECPLKIRYGKAGDCVVKYNNWADKTPLMTCIECKSALGEDYCNERLCPLHFNDGIVQAEAMLEALVMLLPPAHRKEYGG